MGRIGDCVTCYSRQRAAIEADRAGGTSFADLARRYGLAESSVRRHFKRRHAAPPKAKPLERVVCVTRRHLEAIAAEFDLPFADVVFHQLHCHGGNIGVASVAERDELVELMRTHATAEEFREMFGAGADRGGIFVLAGYAGEAPCR